MEAASSARAPTPPGFLCPFLEAVLDCAELLSVSTFTSVVALNRMIFLPRARKTPVSPFSSDGSDLQKALLVLQREDDKNAYLWGFERAAQLCNSATLRLISSGRDALRRLQKAQGGAVAVSPLYSDGERPLVLVPDRASFSFDGGTVRPRDKLSVQMAPSCTGQDAALPQLLVLTRALFDVMAPLCHGPFLHMFFAASFALSAAQDAAGSPYPPVRAKLLDLRQQENARLLDEMALRCRQSMAGYMEAVLQASGERDAAGGGAAGGRGGRRDGAADEPRYGSSSTSVAASRGGESQKVLQRGMEKGGSFFSRFFGRAATGASGTRDRALGGGSRGSAGRCSGASAGAVAGAAAGAGAGAGAGPSTPAPSQCGGGGGPDPAVSGDALPGTDFARLAGVPAQWMLFEEDTSALHAPAHYAFADPASRRLCLVIRGSAERGDVTTDLLYFTGNQRHFGMHQAALTLDRNLRRRFRSWLQEPRFRGFGVLVLGHSLGGGVGTLLVELWHGDAALNPPHAPIRGFSLGAPCVVPPEVGFALKSHVTSVIYAKDVVSRCCPASIDNFNRITSFLGGTDLAQRTVAAGSAAAAAASGLFARPAPSATLEFSDCEEDAAWPPEGSVLLNPQPLSTPISWRDRREELSDAAVRDASAVGGATDVGSAAPTSCMRSEASGETWKSSAAQTLRAAGRQADDSGCERQSGDTTAAVSRATTAGAGEMHGPEKSDGAGPLRQGSSGGGAGAREPSPCGSCCSQSFRRSQTTCGGTAWCDGTACLSGDTRASWGDGGCASAGGAAAMRRLFSLALDLRAKRPEAAAALRAAYNDLEKMLTYDGVLVPAGRVFMLVPEVHLRRAAAFAADPRAVPRPATLTPGHCAVFELRDEDVLNTCRLYVFGSSGLTDHLPHNLAKALGLMVPAKTIV